jgi:hypothetical protein
MGGLMILTGNHVWSRHCSIGTQMLRDSAGKTEHTACDARTFRRAQMQMGSPVMAKGQMRSNREVKKPKQAKKPAPTTLPSGATPIRVTPAPSATQKKH